MRAIIEVHGLHFCLKRNFTGRGGSGWSNNGCGMRLCTRENIAPLVGVLNSTEDQAVRFRALIGAQYRDGLLELAQRVLEVRARDFI